MQQPHSFTIYNASAGSGKTYSLVKEYLKILVQSNHPEKFKHILTITFTNKAVSEMKDRIIETLKQFSDNTILITSNSMFNDMCNELQLEPKTLHEKSKNLLNAIIHNYAAFDISTIDGFTHKLIRTFAHDLRLPLNFEVELDQEALLSEAVDSLISKAGIDASLTKILIDFAIEKTDEDKSWDITFDFNKIAKLLVNENDIPFIETLEDKSLEDFKILKAQLKKEVSVLALSISENAQNALDLIEEAGLEFNDFSSGYLPKHFKKLSDQNFNVSFGNKWQDDIETKTLFPKRVSDNVASVVTQIQPELATTFYHTKQGVFHFKFLKAFYKNITPLSVLNAINRELNTLKTDQNKMLISEFNTIISKEIKDQPTPFIYERIGEKFNHYFIDEFQDTSKMQWDNLIPLIDNSLSTETGSALLVGDAKQAIYRWRGGKAEQFINLFNKKEHPFQVEQDVKDLKTNYRSHKEIINFNNRFFKFLATKVFSKKDYEILYENASQNTFLEENGYVSFTFLDLEKEDDRDALFSENVLRTIQKCLENNFQLKDICILVRKKKEGVAIANYLSRHDIPIISSETLLINNAPEVAFINNVLTLLIKPKNNEVKIAVLNYLTTLFNIENKHDFFSNHIDLAVSALFNQFKTYNIDIDSSDLLQLPLYDLVETIVRKFNLVKTSNAYVQFYLDIVLDFSQKKGSDIFGFLHYFEKKKDTLSIVSPEGQNAVQIMTIHKSKGLEFPVVIFPYADLDIYAEREPKEWFPLNKDIYNGFSHTLLNYNKDFEFYGNDGHRIYTNHRSEQELDNINLLYVTLTRAIEQLHIISKKDISSKGVANVKTYSGFFIDYLKALEVWTDSNLNYSFGSPLKSVQNEAMKTEMIAQEEFISTDKKTHNIRVVTKSGLLWDTAQQDAIEKGNLIHNMMACIKTKDDIDFVIHNFMDAASVSLEQSLTLKQVLSDIVYHPKLENYYTSDFTIYNERDIIASNGMILRPDRVVVNSENDAVIIDYKTGVEDLKHRQQLQLYQDVLEDMGLRVKNKILVYINHNIQIKEIH